MLQLAALILPALLAATHERFSSPPIDRRALVTRHNVIRTAFDPDRPLQVGNGRFAFGMDITGLQSFVPFNTMSDWGWNSLPLPPGTRIEDYREQEWDTHGRPVPYPMPDPQHPAISSWLAGNPHRINLGRIGLVLLTKEGTAATEADVKNPRQELDLWNGIVTSHFELDGQPVTVLTACHPQQDAVAARIESPLLNSGRLFVFLDVPGDDGAQFASQVGDWAHPDSLRLEAHAGQGSAKFLRRLNESEYAVSLSWKGDAELTSGKNAAPSPMKILSARYGSPQKWVDVTELLEKDAQDGVNEVKVGNTLAGDPAIGQGKSLRVTYSIGDRTVTVEHPENDVFRLNSFVSAKGYTLRPRTPNGSFSFVCQFSPGKSAANPDADATFSANRRAWPAFWRSGGAIDLSGSTDPRWNELERRIVLSQYLMRVNEAGSQPPQESGLVDNGWFGRWHMEMYWWHAVHWALWNRWPELNRSLGIYKVLLPQAKQRASEEGFQGARWPKCIGPGGREWPHEIHSLLIWQQPHPIFFAELDYRAHPTQATLKKWQPIVEATADFLASYAFFDKATDRYILGPPLVIVSENTDSRHTENPTFELGYWRFGLRTAQEWRTRMGLPRRADWDRVLSRLSPLPTQDGLYITYEGIREMWTHFNFEHPGLTGALGVLPGDGVDIETMRRTLDKVHDVWNFDRTWGWDFPMMAMCAARLGEPDRAIDFLTTSSPGFQFDDVGLATGGPYPYFPSNGGLLYAVALMAAGWTGSTQHCPGFPGNGKWNVRYEGLSPAP